MNNITPRMEEKLWANMLDPYEDSETFIICDIYWNSDGKFRISVQLASEILT